MNELQEFLTALATHFKICQDDLLAMILVSYVIYFSCDRHFQVTNDAVEHLNSLNGDLFI